MGTAVVFIFLIVICVAALGSIKKRIKYGSACCGTHDAPPRPHNATGSIIFQAGHS